jgi:hypothetical protein
MQEKVTETVPNDIPEISKCKLCNEHCDPTNASGCDRSNEKDCNWYVPSNEEIIKDLLNNEQVIENCLINAGDINHKTKGEWFTVNMLMKKSKFENPQAAIDLLEILCLFGMCYRKYVPAGYIKYRITISDKDRLKLLNSELVDAKGKILQLESEIEKLLIKPQVQ